jgi:putative phosphoribosyl transferase
MNASNLTFEETVRIDTETGSIYGTLATPEQAWGAVLMSHSGGPSRQSSHNSYLINSLHAVGLKTLDVDLLTPVELRVDAFTARHRFDIGLLTDRISAATEWLENQDVLADLRLGYFATGTHAAAALRAAADRPNIAAVISYGGRPELAGTALQRVKAATLLIVGELEQSLIRTNQEAYEQLRRAYRREVNVIPASSHVFDQPGALEEVAHTVGRWFVRYLGAAAWRNRETSRGSDNKITLTWD